jgi:8-oxo-dGTP diphosphatase
LTSLSSTNNQVILFHFTGEIMGGSLQLEANEIIDCNWIMISDLLIPDLNEICEADVIKQITENLIRGKNHSLTFYNQKLVK